MADNMWIHKSRFVWYWFVSKILQWVITVSQESITDEGTGNQRVKFSGWSVNLCEKNLVLFYLKSCVRKADIVHMKQWPRTCTRIRQSSFPQNDWLLKHLTQTIYWLPEQPVKQMAKLNVKLSVYMENDGVGFFLF